MILCHVEVDHDTEATAAAAAYRTPRRTAENVYNTSVRIVRRTSDVLPWEAVGRGIRGDVSHGGLVVAS